MGLRIRRTIRGLIGSVFLLPLNASAIGQPFLDLFSLVDGSEKELEVYFVEKAFLGNAKQKLEVIAYEPVVSNHSLVLFTHGSITSPNEARISYRLLPWAKQFTARGYTFVVWMRAGRGKSEGQTEEFSGNDCDVSKTAQSLERNRDQLHQVITQLNAKYQFKNIFLVGHSRGGIISANFASHHPTQVKGVINLAGAYNQFCDSKNGNYSWSIVKDSARFKTQRWIYYANDTFFGNAYQGFVREVATSESLQYYQIPGHHGTPLLKPDWIPGAIKWFDALSAN